jgi:small subunit ribosomal protein S20
LPNTRSAAKAQRQNERRAARNRSTRSAVRTYFKKATAAVSGADETAAAAVRQAVRALDKAARKGIIHPNAASRRKSKLMSRLHALTVAPPAPVEEPKAAARAPTRGRRTTAGGATRTGATTATRRGTGGTTTAGTAPAATPRRRTPKSG